MTSDGKIDLNQRLALEVISRHIRDIDEEVRDAKGKELDCVDKSILMRSIEDIAYSAKRIIFCYNALFSDDVEPDYHLTNMVTFVDTISNKLEEIFLVRRNVRISVEKTFDEEIILADQERIETIFYVFVSAAVHGYRESAKFKNINVRLERNDEYVILVVKYTSAKDCVPILKRLQKKIEETKDNIEALDFANRDYAMLAASCVARKMDGYVEIEVLKGNFAEFRLYIKKKDLAEYNIIYDVECEGFTPNVSLMKMFMADAV
jgi:hypothetical protein